MHPQKHEALDDAAPAAANCRPLSIEDIAFHRNRAPGNDRRLPRAKQLKRATIWNLETVLDILNDLDPTDSVTAAIDDVLQWFVDVESWTIIDAADMLQWCDLRAPELFRDYVESTADRDPWFAEMLAEDAMDGAFRDAE